MDTGQAMRTRAHVLLGLVCVVFGALPTLVALGLIPAPATSPAPAWVGALAGLIFVVGGVCILIRALDGRRRIGGPPWAGPLQYLTVLAVCGAFAILLSWISIGPGERAFIMSVGGAASGSGAEIIGRAIFGFAAVVAWLCVGVVLLSGLKLLTRRR
jgi:hypothetical protein